MNIADLFQEARDLCDADSTSYNDRTLLRRVNSSLETLIGKIINAAGTWEWDDTNYSDLPIGTGTLVEGQSSYSFAAEYLQIKNIKVLDADGITWHLIHPIDQSEVGYSLEEDLRDDGLPFRYDKVGDTIRLYPAPTAGDVTLSSGIKIEFTRTADLFTCDTYVSNGCTVGEIATGTKEPGIASPWHITIAKMAALPYCKTYKKDRVNQLQRDIEIETRDLINHYGQRERDSRKVMTMEPISFR